MRVNITGKGIIPGIGTLAPKYDVELSESEIRRLVNFERIRVGDAVTGLLITTRNVDDFFKKPEEVTKLTTPITAPKKPSKPKKVVETKSEEVVEITPVIEETIDITNEPIPEIPEPDVVVEVTSTSERIGNVVEVEQEPYETPEITIEETTTEVMEEQPQTYSKKKKRNKR